MVCLMLFAYNSSIWNWLGIRCALLMEINMVWAWARANQREMPICTYRKPNSIENDRSVERMKKRHVAIAQRAEKEPTNKFNLPHTLNQSTFNSFQFFFRVFDFIYWIFFYSLRKRWKKRRWFMVSCWGALSLMFFWFFFFFLFLNCVLNLHRFLNTIFNRLYC